MSEVRLDRIEAKLDQIDGTLRNLTRVEERQSHMMSHITSLMNTITRHDERLRSLEQVVAATAPVLGLWEKVVVAVVTGGGGAAALWAIITRPWSS